MLLLLLLLLMMIALNLSLMDFSCLVRHETVLLSRETMIGIILRVSVLLKDDDGDAVDDDDEVILVNSNNRRKRVEMRYQ